MKRFGNYQYVGEEPMSERDKQEEGSKFWNDGKWNNFVLPFLPKECTELTLIDIGCNAGVFLKLAEDKGFKSVIGVDANKEAYKKAIVYRRRNNGKYKLIYKDMRNAIDDLPITDYTVLAMTHYYFPINDWLDYLDKLRSKTRYCIIVTAEKRENYVRALASTDGIRHYFKEWEETGYIPEMSLDDDPFPRRQWSFCFKSPILERVSIDSLDNDNDYQHSFYDDIDHGKDIFESQYFKTIEKRGRKDWREGKLEQYVESKKLLYEDIKANGPKNPITVVNKNQIIDGHHRHGMLRHLNYKSVLIRRT